ncbi:hypothetical protein CEXT_64691 [Caerostris extrusa]|uniref:Uncharacterized protein n=1 Tax=Caerostris extrusa TaxID=172846 RepID=A0AAV4RJR8_CAEEX|nr:hypothetical protein CEXT_64691 [Caerostris extrusa]
MAAITETELLENEVPISETDRADIIGVLCRLHWSFDGQLAVGGQSGSHSLGSTPWASRRFWSSRGTRTPVAFGLVFGRNGESVVYHLHVDFIRLIVGSVQLHLELVVLNGHLTLISVRTQTEHQA